MQRSRLFHLGRVFLVLALGEVSGGGCEDKTPTEQIFFDSSSHLDQGVGGDRSSAVDSGLCSVGTSRCDQEELQRCDETGRWMPDEFCFSPAHCTPEGCIDPCAPQELPASNLGCEFWAVDLDNEEEQTSTVTLTAASSQFALTVVNPHAVAVNVEVFRNNAAYGLPVAEESIARVEIPAEQVQQIDLPQREVDGSMGQNDAFMANSGSGTFVSSHAYRVQAAAPVAVFQHNPVTDQGSNDGSLLLPAQLLGSDYLVQGWTTANPCNLGGPMELDSIPDHGAVTVVGLTAGTQVTVDLTQAILASADPSGATILATAAGDQVTVTLGPYDVLNLESAADCEGTASGDFTGTAITATAPVALFSNVERASAFGGAKPPPFPEGDTCCTEHIEEQLWPVAHFGMRFALSHSPWRTGTGDYFEPDLFRILAAQDGTTVTTSLSPPFDTFSLQKGEYAFLYAQRGFVLESAGGAVSVTQHLVPKGITGARVGDPSMTQVQALKHFQRRTSLSVPATFNANYVVIVSTADAVISLDGLEVGGGVAGCSAATVGEIDSESYVRLTCPVGHGAHVVLSTSPAGVTVFGYGPTGAFSYPGGISLP